MRSEERLALYRARDDRAAIAAALNLLGTLAFDGGEHERGIALQEESVRLYHDLGDPMGIASSVTNLGASAVDRGDYPRAEHYLEEALVLRHLGRTRSRLRSY